MNIRSYANLDNRVNVRALRRRRSSASDRGRYGNKVKRRFMLEFNPGGAWPVVGNFCMTLTASHDGRTMGVNVYGQDRWYKIGTHRACCAWLARQFREAIQRRCNRATTN